jgi:hypothetical protein
MTSDALIGRVLYTGPATPPDAAVTLKRARNGQSNKRDDHADAVPLTAEPVFAFFTRDPNRALHGRHGVRRVLEITTIISRVDRVAALACELGRGLRRCELWRSAGNRCDARGSLHLRNGASRTKPPTSPLSLWFRSCDLLADPRGA